MLYLLDKDAKTVKWNGIPLHEASSAIVKEEVNGDFVLTVHYPITDSGVYQLIKEDMLIKAPAPVLGAQLFRIKKPVENDDSLDITAYHITDDVMQRSINPVSVVGQGCAIALSQMVQNAKTGLGDFSFTSDIVDRRTFNTTETETLYSVLLDGKHSIVGTWEGELVRDNFALSIKRSRGADRGVVITTHKNLKSYQRTKNSQGVVTRIHARSTFRAEGAETDTVLTVTVDSPLIGNYPYINEKEYENNDAKTIDELKKWAEAKFANEGIDKVSDAIEIEAYELDGQVIHLGDTVNIKSRKHDVDLYKKAIAYEYNALTEEYISITFDDKPGVGGFGVSSGVANAAEAILGANKTAQDVAIDRAVKNASQAFDAEFDKRVEVINDGIEQVKADAELYADNIKQSIDADVNAINQSMQAQSEEHDRQVADILSKTQSVEELANQAKTDAAGAIAEAIRLDTVERQATETKLATAKSQAIAEANMLVETAKSLLSGQVSSVSTDLSQTKEAIKLLATRATVEALTGRVSSAESTLQVQAGEIASRVKTSDFDQAKQRISTAESSVTQLGNRITTEISETVAKIPTSVGGRNLAQKTSSDWSTPYTSFYGTTNNCPSLYKVLIDDLAVGDTLKSRIVLKYTNIIPASGQTARIWLQGDGNVTSWNAGRYADSPVKTISGSGEMVFEHEFKITADHLKNQFWNWQFRTDYIASGSLQWKLAKVEKGPLWTAWSPAPEDVTNEISSVKTTITKTASGVEQLSTSLSTTNNKVTTAETKISQLISDVSSKVSQTDYNTLTGRVNNNETAITQNATEISKRLTSTQVESAITGKGYQTKTQVDNNITGRGYITNSALQPYALSTTVQNLVKETADSFSRTISETKALIPTDYDNQNLWIQSKADGGFVEESLPDNHITGQKKCYKLTNHTSLHFNIDPNFSPRLYQTVTFSAWIKYENVVQGPNAWNVFNCFKHLMVRKNSSTGAVTGTDYLTLAGLTGTSDWKYISYTYDYSANKSYDQLKTPIFFNLEAVSSGTAWVTGVKVELGPKATRYSLAVEDTAAVTALHAVNDTVDSHTRTIGAVGTTGSILDNVSKVTQTAAGLVTEVSGANGLKTQVSTLAGSYAIKNLTNSGTVLNQLNLNKDGSIKLDGSLVQITGKTYIEDGVISSAKIANLDAGKITTGTMDAARIAVNSIDGRKLVFDQAFVNKMTANEALFKQLFAQSAFITSVQAVTLSASQITSGILRATNGAMVIDLNNALTEYKEQATIRFHSAGNVLYREKTHPRGHNTIGALMFKDSNGGGVMTAIGNTSHQTIDTMRNNYGEGGLTGSFAGIRVVRDDADTQRDRVDIIADRIIMAHSTNLQESTNSGFYFYPTAVRGWWNLGAILQNISNKFAEHGWGKIGDIYHLGYAGETTPSQYT